MSDQSHSTNAAGSSTLPSVLAYAGTTIHKRGEMLSLTDMWRAAGSPDQKTPAKWRALPSTVAFAEHVSTVVGKSDNALFRASRGGGDQGTWAHWHLAMPYAKYLDHDFHMWCNTVIRDHMEGRVHYEGVLNELGPDARGAIGGIVKGIIARALGEILPAMVRDHVVARQHAVVEGVSAGQVLEMAGVDKRKGLRGIAVWVSHRLRRFHAVRGVAVRMASLGSSTAYVFDPLIAREWLANGGKGEIEARIAERRGQGALRLVQ